MAMVVNIRVHVLGRGGGANCGGESESKRVSVVVVELECC